MGTPIIITTHPKSPNPPHPSIPHLLHQNPNPTLTQLKQIHAHLFRRSLHHDPILITKLVSAATTSGLTSFATQLFRSLPAPDLILLNSMLKAYTLNSLHSLAVSFYINQILIPAFSPDKFTYPYVLKASAALTDAFLGRQVHASLTKNRNTNADVIVMNSVVDMYFKCFDKDSALKAFRGILEPNSTSWNIVMSGLLSLGDLDSARALFDGMGFERDAVSWNILMGAYANKGRMDVAREIFDRMPERNLVSWNALIAGYCKNGRNDEALEVFSQMIGLGIDPDNATLLSVVSASNGASSLDNGTVDQIVRLAKSMSSVSVSTAVLCLYAKSGRIEEAREVFDQIPEKDLVAWNAMIAGYAQNQRPNEAIQLFRLMQRCGGTGKPDGMTMVSILDSCSQLGALGLGEWVHAYIGKNGVESDVFLMTALIDMYAKCGDLNRAQLIFSEMPSKDLASYNAMIKGMAIHGKGNEALDLFALMERGKLVPNNLTCLGLLSACSHAGLVAEGLKLFESMQDQHGIIPQIEHYGCLVDLLGRAGKVNEAYEILKNMPIRPDAVVWGALLGACRSHQNIELAEEAARRLVELDPNHDGNYVLLSNAYASLGKWGDVEKVRATMRERQVQKEPGCSAVELDGAVYEFTAGDRSHPRSDEIYEAWDELVDRLKARGYEPDTGALVRNLEEEEKEEALYRHSEKLALSFALIGSAARSTIRIVKNLRICKDCHRVMEMASEIEGREIVVRDRSRFHCFSNGHCSCGGYW